MPKPAPPPKAADFLSAQDGLLPIDPEDSPWAEIAEEPGFHVKTRVGLRTEVPTSPDAVEIGPTPAVRAGPDAGSPSRPPLEIVQLPTGSPPAPPAGDSNRDSDDTFFTGKPPPPLDMRGFLDLDALAEPRPAEQPQLRAPSAPEPLDDGTDDGSEDSMLGDIPGSGSLATGDADDRLVAAAAMVGQGRDEGLALAVADVAGRVVGSQGSERPGGASHVVTRDVIPLDALQLSAAFGSELADEPDADDTLGSDTGPIEQAHQPSVHELDTDELPSLSTRPPAADTVELDGLGEPGSEHRADHRFDGLGHDDAHDDWAGGWGGDRTAMPDLLGEDTDEFGLQLPEALSPAEHDAAADGPYGGTRTDDGQARSDLAEDDPDLYELDTEDVPVVDVDEDYDELAPFSDVLGELDSDGPGTHLGELALVTELALIGQFDGRELAGVDARPACDSLGSLGRDAPYGARIARRMWRTGVGRLHPLVAGAVARTAPDPLRAAQQLGELSELDSSLPRGMGRSVGTGGGSGRPRKSGQKVS